MDLMTMNKTHKPACVSILQEHTIRKRIEEWTCFSKFKMYMVTTQMTAVFLGCGSADEVVDYVMMTACSLNGLAKIAAIHVHMDKVSMVFFSILDDWSTITERNLQDIMTRFAKTGRSVFKFQATSCCISNFLIFIGTLPFLMPPVDESSRDNSTEIISIPRELPLKTGCMFGNERNSIYSFLYIYDGFNMMTCACGNIGTDVFFFCLMMHICGQLEILRLDVREIGTAVQGPQEVYEQITSLIRKHSRLMELIHALQEACSVMLVIQILMVAGLYLMLGIRLIMSVNRGIPADAVRAGIAFSVIMLQIYLFSYASEQMSHQSRSIVDALYESNWYELAPNIRKDIYFMMVRASKPCYLNAGQFYYLNLENFKNTLKASFSYFSILRVMFEEEDYS